MNGKAFVKRNGHWVETDIHPGVRTYHERLYRARQIIMIVSSLVFLGLAAVAIAQVLR